MGLPDGLILLGIGAVVYWLGRMLIVAFFAKSVEPSKRCCVTCTKEKRFHEKKSQSSSTSRGRPRTSKRAEQTGGRFDSPVKRGFNMWRPEAGETLSILPPTWEDFDHYGYEVFITATSAPTPPTTFARTNSGARRIYHCDRPKQLKADREDGPTCIGIQERVWVWVIDRDDKSGAAGLGHVLVPGPRYLGAKPVQER